MSAIGPKQTWASALHMSASDPSDCDAKCWLGLIYINGVSPTSSSFTENP